MKRRIAVCVVTGFLLVTSTAAFATPIMGTWAWNAPGYDNTVSSGFTKTFASDWSSTITWFQPYSNASAPTLPTAAGLGLDPAGTLTWSSPTIKIDSASLKIIGNDTYCSVGETEPVWRGTSSSAWVASLGNLTQGLSTTTTTFTLSNPTWLAPTGFYLQARIPGSNQLATITSSELKVAAEWDYSYSYEAPLPPPAPPAPVPAPGAILLVSLGAGLVPWLRARKAL
jgi:hypothetical protein